MRSWRLPLPYNEKRTMDWLYTLMLALIVFATVAMMIREGLWSNVITLLNVVFAGVLAFGLYEPLTVWVDEMIDGEWTYTLDFVLLWGVFFLAAGLMRLITDLLSRVRVRFRMPVEAIGGPLTAALTAWVLVGFVGATMHTAPLAKEFLKGAIVTEEEDWGSLTRADLQWLEFVGRQITTTSLSSGEVFNDLPSVTAEESPQFVLQSKGGERESVKLDADLGDGEKWARYFVAKYAYRRGQFDAQGAHLRVDRGS